MSIPFRASFAVALFLLASVASPEVRLARSYVLLGLGHDGEEERKALLDEAERLSQRAGEVRPKTWLPNG